MNDIKDHERNYDKIEERGLPALLKVSFILVNIAG